MYKKVQPLLIQKIKEPIMEREVEQKFPGAGFFKNINFWKSLRLVHADPATKKSNVLPIVICVHRLI